ncbi:lipase family alpha/beta hydrolase [Actinacidiphila acididurans]|uniref:Alpha/beta fold hydrolase n=1 Tax=Actinacidiphila acididurans TaxID=2784346 RepID=A0ABS2TRU7_9ACTN|nr:alpha/beta fold hydrolase [Actinacidiphila acididurans]MBM9504698.1 alpha/beta fold hydrolase [Actinacidiphila acididurans]
MATQSSHDRSSHGRPAHDQSPHDHSQPRRSPHDQPSAADQGDRPGESPRGYLAWGKHGADLVRVTAIDLAVLAGHMLLYPTGILPERVPSPSAPADDPTDSPAENRTGHPAENPGSDQEQRPAAPATGPPDGRPHPPVLLLHGFVDNRSAFTLLRRSLQRHGWPRVQALNYSPLTNDIRTAARLLGPHIERICEQSGHRRVDIVAHSLGGLIARYYVQCLGGDSRVRTLITLGTPHAGTRAVPALAPHPLARQMRPGSEVLEELAGPAKGCRTRFVAFWSDLDQFMIPAGAACLTHPDLMSQNIAVRGIGHLSLPVHGTVAAEIRRTLAYGGPMRGAADAA